MIERRRCIDADTVYTGPVLGYPQCDYKTVACKSDVCNATQNTFLTLKFETFLLELNLQSKTKARISRKGLSQVYR